MLYLVVFCVLSCAVEGRLRKPAGSDVADKLEVVERKSTPVFKKVAQEMQMVAKELEQGTVGKNKTVSAEALKKATASVADVKKEFEAVKKEFDAAINSDKKKNDTEQFPWWNQPNLTLKAEKKNDTKGFPWWNQPNLTLKAEKKNDTEQFPWWNQPNLTLKAQKKNDTEQFPWWNQPNLTFTKTEKAPKKDDKKFPWWANASARNVPNFTQIIKDLPKDLPKGQPSFADLGPFESKEAACDYCFTSHTRSSVVPNCICTAYEGASGPTMFCTASAAGVKWVAEKDGGCKCVEKNPSQMGQTTCDPF